MSHDITHWLVAFIAASVIAGAATHRRSLSRDGAIAAVLMGTLIVGFAGWWAGLLLVLFFTTSSVLSHKGDSATVPQARGSERDAVQVMANGGVALAAAITHGINGNPTWIVVLAGAIAAANADTWSTEIGRTSHSLPRLLTSGQTVPAGTSGAVSRRGIAGALTGAALIGCVAGIGWETGWLPGDSSALLGATAVTLGGFTGSLVDSLLGATIQDQRWCDSCEKQTEQRIHWCGTRTRSLRGLDWVNNDVVNLTCSVAGGAIALLLPGIW